MSCAAAAALCAVASTDGKRAFNWWTCHCDEKFSQLANGVNLESAHHFRHRFQRGEPWFLFRATRGRATRPRDRAGHQPRRSHAITTAEPQPQLFVLNAFRDVETTLHRGNESAASFSNRLGSGI